MTCVLIILAVFIYIIIGWFVRALCQEEWESPSLLLTIVWPALLFLMLMCKILEIVEALAISIKEKYDEK